MSFQLPRRLPPALAGVLAAAGLMLTAASCSHLAPLGPYTGPQSHQLRSPIVLQALRIQQATPAGGCPAGYVPLSGGNPGQCYGKTGAPVTITSAVVSPVNLTAVISSISISGVIPSGQPTPTPSPGPQTTQYGFVVAVPAAEVPALTAVTTTAGNVSGALAISVAGRTWAIPLSMQPGAHGQFHVLLPSRKQALQLQRILAPAG
jgi:hypothetical protein